VRRIICITLAIASVGPAGAQAAEPVGAGAAGTVALAGDQVLWGRQGKADLWDVVSASLADGTPRIVAQTRTRFDLSPGIDVTASPSRFAYVRSDNGREGKYQYPTPMGAALFDGPNPEPVLSCPRGYGIEAAVAGAALVYTNCAGDRLFVAEPGRPTRAIEQPHTAHVSEMRAAGRYVAVDRWMSGPPELAVYDVTSGREVLKLTTGSRPSSFSRAFDVQEDGKLLVAWYDGAGQDRLSWVSPRDPARHDVPTALRASIEYPAVRTVAIERDRVAATVGTECATATNVTVAGPLEGPVRALADPGPRSGVAAFDGRVALLSHDGHGLLVRDLDAEPPTGEAVRRDCVPPADQRWQVTGALAASSAEPALAVRRGQVAPPVYCSFHTVGSAPGSHCDGWIRIEGRGRRLLGLRHVRLGPALEHPRVKLNATARALLRRKRSVRARVVTSGRRDPRSGYYAADVTLRAQRR
jgi:hypothetical protein